MGEEILQSSEEPGHDITVIELNWAPLSQSFMKGSAVFETALS